MGTVYADLTLKNYNDLVKVENGLLEKNEARFINVNAIVDTGAGTLVISEEQRRELGLEPRKENVVTLANGAKETVIIADPVQICWKNRYSICFPWVVKRPHKVLLGAIPLEDMDLIVDPGLQALIGRHGDEVQGYLL